MPSAARDRHCVCWRCTDHGRRPEGRSVTRNVYANHRRSGWLLAPPTSSSISAPIEPDFSDDDSDSDGASETPSIANPNNSAAGNSLKEAPTDAGVGSGGMDAGVEPMTGSPRSALSGDLDQDMEDLTGDLTRLAVRPPLLEKRMIEEREVLWETPEDEEEAETGAHDDAEGSDEDEDGILDPEELKQAAADWDWYERLGDSGHLTAAQVLTGQFFSNFLHLRQGLDPLDLRICRSYAWKLRSHLTDGAFKSMPHAFPELFDGDNGLPGLDEHRSRIASLSGLQSERYHCCVNSCICYVGPYADDTECSFCHEKRYRADGKPRKIFNYLPLLPRLQAFFQNKTMIKLLRYRADYEGEEGIIGDVFDCKLYRDLCEREIELDGPDSSSTRPPKYFGDPRDIALGLSTDGFAPFKRRRQTAWPLIIFIYNLPPEVRFHMEYILSLGVIPGPLKPKDMCSFLYPLVMELLRLEQGVNTYDVSSDSQFMLRAFLVLVFGDIPAVSMVMRMKGHNGYTPCRACHIHGVPVPDAAGKTLYVPLDRSTHPSLEAGSIPCYDPRKLPLRTHAEFCQQAKEVDNARTNTEAERLARLYGIKGTPILTYLRSLQFPLSFPFDFMHLIWENLIPNLILLWTGKFKGLDAGREPYTVDAAIWEAIGKSTAAAGSTIPSAFGTRVPDLAKGGFPISAEMHAIWTQFIAPTCLRRAFTDRKYYDHFVLLVQIINLCLQFELSREQLQWLKEKIPQWVETYESFYYQRDPARLSTCTLTVHALLHIPDAIEMCGPQWCYWAFPMERYCGRLQPGIRSRRFPFASLDRYVLETAQLSLIGVLYNVTSELALRPLRGDPKGSCRVPEYPAALLLGPHKTIDSLPNRLIGALATRFSNRKKTVTGAMVKRDFLKNAEFSEWTKIRRVDSEAGDTMVAALSPSPALSNRQDLRDPTFVRYEMYIDEHARQRNVDPKLVPQTYYGQLQHIYLIRLNNAEPMPQYKIPAAHSIIMVDILACDVTEIDERLDLPRYGKMKTRGDAIDATSLQCVVGRVSDSPRVWSVVDRSGSLARALYLDDVED